MLTSREVRTSSILGRREYVLVETVTSLHRSVASLEDNYLIHTRAHHRIEILGKIEEK
jgi:hypothetical protein